MNSRFSAFMVSAALWQRWISALSTHNGLAGSDGRGRRSTAAVAQTADTMHPFLQPLRLLFVYQYHSSTILQYL